MNKLLSAVDKNRQLILDAERYIWQNPETGYKEFKTSAYLEKAFEDLGYELVKAENITGFYTVIDTGRKGPEVLILGELDSVLCPEHPESDKTTGAVHACGHNAQCAGLLGIAAALREDGVLDGLCGKIRLCAVPAEELLEIEYRTGLKKQGIIKYFGGKTEFLYRGMFDGVDMAIMVHTADNFYVNKGSVGCLAKRITYKGVAAHAGGAPWNGVNALYAANCGINAVNAIRETFKESDIIRFHPIITTGGSIVNAIPETAVIESYVRGSAFDAIVSANKRVNRALVGGALSIGANVDIEDTPGYAPLINDNAMIDVSIEAAKLAIPEYEFTVSPYMSSGSTDIGDLSCVMPVVQPYAGGKKGKDHGNNYYITDADAACVASAKYQLGMLYLLLKDNAERANKILSEFKPLFSSKKEYFDFVDSLGRSGDRIAYGEGEAVISL